MSGAEIRLALAAVAAIAAIWWALGPAAAGQCAVIAVVLVVGLSALQERE